MEPVFSVIAILFFVLYIRERRKNREMESNYNYINSRLLAIANTDDSNYILVPTDMGVVRETAKSINSLLVNMEDRPLYANVDVEAIRRVLKNLIDNAITHGGAGKFLGISLYENENHICIEVEDHGARISAKDITHIFTRAYTADRGKGNGLGRRIEIHYYILCIGYRYLCCRHDKKICINDHHKRNSFMLYQAILYSRHESA